MNDKTLIFEPVPSNDTEFELLEKMAKSIESIAKSLQVLVDYIQLEYDSDEDQGKTRSK